MPLVPLTSTHDKKEFSNTSFTATSDTLHTMATDNLFNSLPNNKILDSSKLEAFADKTINVAHKLKILYGNVENVGKGENAGYQHFLLFPQCFQKALSVWSFKVKILWERVKSEIHTPWHSIETGQNKNMKLNGSLKSIIILIYFLHYKHKTK